MENFGFVTVYAYTSNARLPVEGALVRISQGEEELFLGKTDRSGYVAPLRVAAPALADSQSPNGSTPFATVDIRITHPDYETEKAMNVQVFPGTVTVQSFRMIPENPQYGGSEVDIETSNQNL